MATKRGTTNPMMPQTSVGDDACIVPGTLRRRKVCGRAMALPYNRGKRPTIRHPAISAAPRNLRGTPHIPPQPLNIFRAARRAAVHHI